VGVLEFLVNGMFSSRRWGGAVALVLLVETLGDPRLGRFFGDSLTSWAAVVLLVFLPVRKDSWGYYAHIVTKRFSTRSEIIFSARKKCQRSIIFYVLKMLTFFKLRMV